MSRADDIRNRISDEYEKTPGYLLWDVSEAVGQEMDLQDITAEETKSMFYVDNLTGDYLTSFVKERKGIERRAATYAIGSLTITGNGAITIGDIFETANGVQFSAAETKTIAEEGTVNIKVFEQDDEIIFIVSDDGVGMSEERIQEIMEGILHQ